MITCFSTMISLRVPSHPAVHSQQSDQSTKPSITITTSIAPSLAQVLPTISARRSRRYLLCNSIIISTVFPPTFFSFCAPSFSTISTPSSDVITEFYELPNSGGVKALDLRAGSGSTPIDGDQVAIHYYGRLAAKQGWRFDSTYDHKDSSGEAIPFFFILGSGKVISGIEAGVRSMSVGGIRRLIIPPSQGYQSTTQEPIPPNFFDRQRLFTTIFNPTRLANGEGSTLGTLIFDIELVNVKHYH